MSPRDQLVRGHVVGVLALFLMLFVQNAAGATTPIARSLAPAAAAHVYDAFGYDAEPTVAIGFNGNIAAPVVRIVRTEGAAAFAPSVKAYAYDSVADLVAPRLGLGTQADEAVFWSGIRGGDAAAADWVAKNGGASLESTIAHRGINLPAWDSSNPATVAAWRNASREFAEGASGNVRVLQTDAVRVNSVWAEVEFTALTANPNVSSITAVNPNTGSEVLLWGR